MESEGPFSWKKMKFLVDLKEQQKFRSHIQRFPRLVKPAVAKTLTKQAADMKFQHIPKALQGDMVIRDSRFMNRQLRYIEAKKTTRIALMYSEVGSVGIEKGSSKGAFTGWEEQQTGQASEKSRVATTAARIGNDFSNKMRPKDRMKKQNISRFVTPRDFMNSKRVHSKNQAMFFMLRESKNSRRPFIIPKGFRRTGATRKMKAGLYGWIGKRLMRLQRFDRKYKPERMDWMGSATKLLVKKRGGFDKIFRGELAKIVNNFNRTT